LIWVYTVGIIVSGLFQNDTFCCNKLIFYFSSQHCY